MLSLDLVLPIVALICAYPAAVGIFRFLFNAIRRRYRKTDTSEKLVVRYKRIDGSEVEMFFDSKDSASLLKNLDKFERDLLGDDGGKHLVKH